MVASLDRFKGPRKDQVFYRIQGVQMGLDSVELVMEVEETFGINISDADASRMLTVGDLYDEIVKQYGVSAESKTFRVNEAFESIQNGLSKLGFVEKTQPSTPVSNILPAKKRLDFWADLGNQSDVKLPDLVLSPAVGFGVKFVYLSSLLLPYYFVYISLRSHWVAFFVTITGFTILVNCSGFLTRWKAVHPDTHWRTLRGLSETVVLENRQVFDKDKNQLDAEGIWIALRNLISIQIGVPQEKVTPDANFVSDLGFD